MKDAVQLVFVGAMVSLVKGKNYFFPCHFTHNMTLDVKEMTRNVKTIFPAKCQSFLAFTWIPPIIENFRSMPFK